MGCDIILSDARLRWLRAAFTLVWLVGLAGVMAAPALRFAMTPRSDDPYEDLLLTLHPNNAYFHPYFYQPMKDALDALMQQLPPEQARVALVVYAGADLSDVDANGGERLRRNISVWVYPRMVGPRCTADESGTVDCNLPEGVPVVTWGVDDLPGYSCTTGETGLRLCR